MDDRYFINPSRLKVGLSNCCPRCGEGKLFRSYLTPASACEKCDLDYAFIDAGDGPAVFIMMIAGFLIVGLALYVEFTYHPPYWLHALLWLPLTIVLPMALLRPLKGWLIAQQFRHRASEGRLEL
jgi:uncharacterized protein (DUF983 family)